jgi:hypothetical protein
MKTVLGVIEPPPQAILPQAIVIEPPPVPVQEQLPSRSKKRFECPFCHSHEPPEYRNEMTTVGWLLVIPAVLSCVGLIIWLVCQESLKERVQRCYDCGMRLSQRDFL